MKPSAHHGTVFGETRPWETHCGALADVTHQSRTHADTAGSVDVMSGFETKKNREGVIVDVQGRNWLPAKKTTKMHWILDTTKAQGLHGHSKCYCEICLHYFHCVWRECMWVDKLGIMCFMCAAWNFVHSLYKPWCLLSDMEPASGTMQRVKTIIRLSKLWRMWGFQL